MEKCQFDKGEKGCYALACYSRQKCGARDEKGNPAYVDLDEIKKETQSPSRRTKCLRSSK